MRHHLKKLQLPAIIIYAFCFPAADVFAQVLPFHTYTIHDGLISNAVNAMYQDTRGYLWIGTTDGLSVYDGTTFRNYTTNDGLGFSHINDITESRQSPGTMWIATNGGGVTRVRDGEFHTIKTGASPWTNRVNAVIEDHNGTVWCGADEGVFRIRGDSAEPFHAETHFSGVASVVETNDSLIWISSPYHLYFYEPLHDRLEEFDTHPHKGAVFTKLWKDRAGDVWACRSDSVILHIAKKTIAHSITLPYYAPMSLLEDNSGNLWAGSANGLTKIINCRSSRPRFLRYTTANGLKDNAVVVSLMDKENNFWLYCFNNGISRLSDLAVTRFPHPIDFSSGNNGMVTIDRNNHFWIATGDYLCEFWDDTQGEWHHYHHNVAGKPYSVCFDTAGRLFVRLLPGGFNEYEIHPVRDSHSDIVLKLSLRKGKDFPDFAPLCFLVDKNDRIWCALDTMVARIDLTMPGHPVTFYGRGQGLHDESIRAFYEDRAGNIWCGGYINGAAVIDPSTNSVTTYSTANGLPDNSVRSFWQESGGTMWVATRYGGVGIMRQHGVETLALQNGLLSNAITSISGDKTGNVWFGTLAGLQYMSSSRHKLITNDELTGIRVHSFAVREDGKILIVTTDGFILYDHAVEQFNTTPPPIYISRFQINDRAISLAPHLKFSHDQNNCTIEFVGISLRNEQNIRYQYKLQQSEEAWQTPTTQRAIVYRELRPGMYTFMVQAINSDGIVSIAPATLEFEILSPYWLRWWFIALCVLTIASIIVAGIRVRVRRLLEIERLRSRIAADLHDDIGSGLIRIALLSEVIHRQTASRENSLTDQKTPSGDESYSISTSTQKVGMIARELVDAMSDVVWSIDPKNDSLEHLIRRIEAVAFESCEAKGIQLSFNAPAVIRQVKLSSAILRCVLLITKEALTNIVRHAECTSVQMNIGLSDNNTTLDVKISDNGKGFDVETLSRINGMENMRLRAEKTGGKFTITPKKNQGTSITLSVPLKI